MTPIVNEAQAKLIPLAFDLNNRIWMEGYCGKEWVRPENAEVLY